MPEQNLITGRIQDNGDGSNKTVYAQANLNWSSRVQDSPNFFAINITGSNTNKGFRIDEPHKVILLRRYRMSCYNRCCGCNCGCEECQVNSNNKITYNITTNKHFYGRQITRLPKAPVGCASLPNCHHNHNCHCSEVQDCPDKVTPDLGILQCGCPETA